MVAKPTDKTANPAAAQAAVGISPTNTYARPRTYQDVPGGVTDIFGNDVFMREPHPLETIRQDPSFVDIIHAGAGLTATAHVYRNFKSVNPEELRDLGFMPRQDNQDWEENVHQIANADLEKLEDQARFLGYASPTSHEISYLHNAKTPDQYAKRLQNLLDNREINRTLSASPGSTIAASFLISLFEPQNFALLPVAGMGKISTAAAAARGAGFGAGLAAVEEVAFHQTDPNREVRDSLANMAFSSVIFAGIGTVLGRKANAQRQLLNDIDGYLSEADAINRVILNVDDYLPEGGATVLRTSEVTVENLLAMNIVGLGRKRAEKLVRNIREMFESTPMTADDFDAMSLAGLPERAKKELKARLFVDDALELSDEANRIHGAFGASHVLGKSAAVTSVLNSLMDSPFPEVRKLASEIFESPYLTTSQVKFGQRAPVALEQEIATKRINSIEQYQSVLYRSYQKYLGRDVESMGELGQGRTGVFFRGIGQAARNIVTGQNLNYANIATPKGFMNLEEFQAKAVMYNRGSLTRADLGDAADFIEELSNEMNNFYSRYRDDIKKVYKFLHGENDVDWNDGAYLTRIWNRHQIERDPNLFKDFLINQLIKKYGDDAAIEAATGYTIEKWKKSIDKSIRGILSSPADRLIHEQILDVEERLGTFDRLWNFIDEGDLYSTDFVIKNFSSIAHQYATAAIADSVFFRKFGTFDLDQIIGDLREKMVKRIGNRDLTTIEKQRIEKDLFNVRRSLERVRGIYMSKHSPLPGSLPQRVIDSSMKFANITIADGFGIGSLVDIGRPIVFMGLSKGLGTIFRQFAFGNAKHLKALGAANRQLRSFMVGNEINQQILISSMTNVNMNEKTGTMLETIISDANNAMFMANGLSNWNQFIKRAVGVSVVDEIIENANLAVAGKLPKAKRDQMLKLHLNEDDLKLIASEFKKHGSSYKKIHLMNFENWDLNDDKKLDLFNRLSAGIRKEVDTIIITPGMGDTPLVMENSWVKMVGQYRIFQLASMNRGLIPLTQQGINPDVAMGIVISAGIGQAIDQYQAFVDDRPYDAGNWAEQLWNGLGDSAALGSFGMFVNYVDMAAEGNPSIAGAAITGILDMGKAVQGLGGNPTPSEQRALMRSIPFANLMQNFTRPMEYLASSDSFIMSEANAVLDRNLGD